MIASKQVRVEFSRTETQLPAGASGSIDISDTGRVAFNTDAGMAISVEMSDLLDVLQRAVMKKR